MADARREHDPSIWLYAFGDFACYAPYGALTKAMSAGLYPGLGKVSGFALLPVSTVVSLLGMFVFLTAMGCRASSRRGARRARRPREIRPREPWSPALPWRAIPLTR